MRVLTYVNRELTVIRDNDFYRKQDTKPSFITGSNFYYEPTLKQMDGQPLSSELEAQAEDFIANFVFPMPNNVVQEVKVHCVDTDGNYIGYMVNDNNYIEVSTAPISDDEKWINGAWTKAVLIDKTTGYYKGIGDTRTSQNSSYAPATIPTDFDESKYYWDGSAWQITLADAKEAKKSELKQDQVKSTGSIVGLTAYLEPTSFDLQEQEARAWGADNSVATPFLDNLLASRSLGETKQELVDKIIAKADGYKQTYAQILGRFQALIRQVDLATTEDELKAIVWS